MRKLWWIASTVQEYESWNLEAKGAKIISVEVLPDRVDVIFAIDPKDAQRICGYEVAEDEYLDEEEA